MWAQRSVWVTQSTSFRGVSLTRLAHAVGLPAVAAVPVAFEATGVTAPATASAAAAAIVRPQPRRRPSLGLILATPSLTASPPAPSSTSPTTFTAVSTPGMPPIERPDTTHDRTVISHDH